MRNIAAAMTEEDILAAFWIPREALILVSHAAMNGAGEFARTVERGLSMADAEALLGDAAA